MLALETEGLAWNLALSFSSWESVCVLEHIKKNISLRFFLYLQNIEYN